MNTNKRDKLNSGILGPLNIFPGFFFSKELDKLWRGAQVKQTFLKGFEKKEYFLNLTQSPLGHLNFTDLKILYFLNMQEIHTLSLKILEKPEVKKEVYLKLLHIEKIKKNITFSEEKKGHNNDAFIMLGLIFETFYLALSESNNKSRKLMGLTEFYIDEFSEKRHHPYLDLLKVLTFVARDNWVSATKTLQAFTDQYPHKNFNRVLIKLYEKIGMPQVAYYLKQKQKKEDLKLTSMARIQTGTGYSS